MEGWVPPDLPGIFAANPPTLAELPGRKSGRRSARGHPSLLATELWLTSRDQAQPILATARCGETRKRRSGVGGGTGWGSLGTQHGAEPKASEASAAGESLGGGAPRDPHP